jgi:thiamine kinase-like enzyme
MTRDEMDIIRRSRFGLPFSASARARAAARPGPIPPIPASPAMATDLLGRIGAEHGFGRGGCTVSKLVRLRARRPVFLATTSDERLLLLKFLDALDDPEAPNELVMLGALRTSDLERTVVSHVPRLLAYDARSGVLVFEGLRGARNLRESSDAGEELSLEHAARIAELLASLHRLEVDSALRAHPDRILQLPFQSMLDITPEELSQGPGLEYGLFVEAVQAIDEELGKLAAQWYPRSFVHFDARDDNILLIPPRDATPGRVALVDWEMSGFGDPLYDVGTVIGQLVYDALRRINHGQEPQIPGRLITAFVAVYGHAASVSPDEVAARAVPYAGLFLLQRALATMQVVGGIGSAGHLALALGRQFLSNPRRVAAEVML